jgi:signal transduction histidine kinase
MEAMIDGVWEPTGERLICCYEEIVRLNRLVEDLNLLSILEQKNLILQRTEFDLIKLINAAAERFRAAALEKGIAINVADPGVLLVNGDYDRLTQVFINLVSNAVKYTDRGSVTIATTETQEYCEIRVSDTGIGMGAEELSHVFERFYRSDKSRSRLLQRSSPHNPGGAGIGLTIAQTIVDAHGGQVRAESEAGKGSVFAVRLPYK